MGHGVDDVVDADADAEVRIVERLGFSFERIQRGANILPGGKNADRYCYARFDSLVCPNWRYFGRAIGG